MKQLMAFTKKEFMELLRTGRLTVLLIIFVLFGVMNPAITKLTPWMISMLSESLEQAGMVVAQVTVDAYSSWIQFYKNIPIMTMIFVLMFGSTMTGEYQKGTLINMLTKGLKRWKVLAAKGLAMLGLWTVGYWLCYGITYGYNAYFWDNGVVSHPAFAACCMYVFGVWLISLILLASVLFRSGASVLLAVGGIFGSFYLLGLLPDLIKYLPIQLLSASGLLSTAVSPSDFGWAIGGTLLLTFLGTGLSAILFNHRTV